MKVLVHGGDIYSFTEKNSDIKPVDFSANINPLGIPEAVRKAIIDSADDCTCYPDPLCRALRTAISESENVPKDWIFCGNGAADVLFRLALALKPKKAVIPAPAFSEYEISLINTDCKVKLHYLSEHDDFELSERILDEIDGETDIVYLCNPNNPTGKLISPELTMKILDKCVRHGAYLLIDECFNDFLSAPNQYTLKGELEKHENLIVLRAFTKLYAIPGIRLGYCMTSNEKLMSKLYQCGQPWNVSVVAQKCGVAALKDKQFPELTRKLIGEQREYLMYEMKKLGFKVFDSTANYIFFKNEIVKNLKEALEKYGVLIRSCANYHGLDNRYFRIAVKSQRDNQYLMDSLHKVVFGKEEM